MYYKHLTAADRGAIEALLQRNCTLKDIAVTLGVSAATVSREISKRSTPNGYRAKSAQFDYERRRQRSRQRCKLKDHRRQQYLCEKLQVGWSPEQIAGRLKLEGRDDLYVCPETIYRFLYEDAWARQEALSEYLRLGRKKRKKQTGRAVHRHKIPNRVSIHDRPQIVAERVEFGHCEGDSVIYPQKLAINTLNELSTGLLRFTKLDRKTAKLSALAMIRRLKHWGAKTLTLDNGSEHMLHEQITQQAKVSVFFADPYASWQRASNENSNMLLRGYLPKRCDISNLMQEELDDIAEELNNRPRKRLGFRTPNEVYQQVLQSQKGGFVALGIRM